MNTLENTRRSARTEPKDFAFIQIFGDDGGKILNISDSGLSFESFAPLGPARTLQFWFSLNLHERVEAMGEVIWLDSGTKVGGLRFVNPTDRVLQHIRRYSTNVRSGTTNGKGQRFVSALAKLRLDTMVHDAGERPSTPAPGGLPSSVPSPKHPVPAKDTPLELLKNLSMESTDLIPSQRHREVVRQRFLWGFLLGLFLASTLTVALFRFWAPKPPVTLPKSSNAPFAASEPKPEHTVEGTPAIGDARQLPRHGAPADATALHVFDIKNSPKKTGLTETSGGLARSPDPSGLVAKKSSNKSATPQQLWSAVEVGDASAAVTLADRYLRGDGVPANCLQARVLLLVASEKKNAAGIKMLEQLDKTGCPADPNQ